LGALTSLPVIALFALGERFAGLPFLPFDLFDWVSRVLPGAVITFGIDLMVALIRGLQLGPTDTTAKLAEQALALIQVVAGGALLGAILAWLARRGTMTMTRWGLAGGAGLFFVSAAGEASLGRSGLTELVWIGLLLLTWGAALGSLIGLAGPALSGEPGARFGRRSFLYLVGGGVVSISVGSLALARPRRTEAPVLSAGEETLDLTGTSGPAASPPPEALAARIEPAPGTRAEITSNAEFYRIDINTRPPVVDGDSWRLEITGLVENPLSLTLDDIRSRPAVSQVITLQCISNPIAGDLTSTSVWTGVRLKSLLEEAGMLSATQEAFIESADGFYEGVEMADILDDRTLLVYAMNGVPLPVEHGFPLRIYIPNRYGMKQPKWIERIELIDREGPGYWVERGWSREARPQTVSAIDAVAQAPDEAAAPSLPVGGIAYAGARGISRVEVQVDDGPWQEASLRTPAVSPLTWVQWRYDWPYQAGQHVFRVRAHDGEGKLQITDRQSPRPDGATGIHEVTVDV
jgi:DMSO/TMAO reductase YedYZ molybdopterin-dependent catalytic subunit